MPPASRPKRPDEEPVSPLQGTTITQIFYHERDESSPRKPDFPTDLPSEPTWHSSGSADSIACCFPHSDTRACMLLATVVATGMPPMIRQFSSGCPSPSGCATHPIGIGRRLFRQRRAAAAAELAMPDQAQTQCGRSCSTGATSFCLGKRSIESSEAPAIGLADRHPRPQSLNLPRHENSRTCRVMRGGICRRFGARGHGIFFCQSCRFLSAQAPQWHSGREITASARGSFSASERPVFGLQ